MSEIKGNTVTIAGAISASNVSGSNSGSNTGDVTLAAVDSSPNANGASLSGQILTLQPANGSNPGLVSTTTQSFAGNKTFTGTVGASNLSGTNTGDQTITLTSDVTGSGTGSFATTIANNAVTNAKAAQMAAHTFKGNNTGSTANALDLTATQLTAELNLFTTSLQGLVPSSGGGTTNFLRADGTFAIPPGTGANTALSNLTTTSINQNLIADGNQTRDLGASGTQWNNCYIQQGVASLRYISNDFGGNDFNTNGAVLFHSQNSNASDTGTVNFKSGDSSAGNSGDLNFQTGTATGTRGKLLFTNPIVVLNSGAHLRSTQTTPPTSVVTGNAGTGASTTLFHASDVCGDLQLVTGAAAFGSGDQVDVTFNVAYTNVPIVNITPQNANAAIAMSTRQVYVTSSTTGFSINFVVADIVGTTYSWFYTVIESTSP